MSKVIWVLTLTAAAVVCIVLAVSRRAPVSTRTNIGAITASNQTWQFIAPAADRYELLIGFPTAEPDRGIVGEVAVRVGNSGSNAVTWAFNGASCEEANWLKVYGLSALLLN